MQKKEERDNILDRQEDREIDGERECKRKKKETPFSLSDSTSICFEGKKLAESSKNRNKARQDKTKARKGRRRDNDRRTDCRYLLFASDWPENYRQ